MSEQSQGPGWWLASDGRWYPPDQAPAVPPPETWATPPPGPPPPSGMSTGAKVAIAVGGGLVALLVLSVLLVAFVGEESGSRFSSTGTAVDDGDGDAAEPAPAAEVPDGFVLVEGDRVSIAVPDGWREVDPEDFSMDSEQLEQAFPDAPPGFLDQATAAFEKGATLVAFDRDITTGANVNIASFPGEAPLSAVEAEAVKQLEALDGSVVSSDSVTVPAGDAHRIEYTIDIAGPDGTPLRASGVQFYVVTDGRTHVVTITTAAGDVGPLADQMIDTFRAS